MLYFLFFLSSLPPPFTCWRFVRKKIRVGVCGGGAGGLFYLGCVGFRFDFFIVFFFLTYLIKNKKGPYLRRYYPFRYGLLFFFFFSFFSFHSVWG